MLAACLTATSATAQEWSVELYAGDAYSFRNRLGIEQDGFSRSVSADWRTRGTESPLYYVMRGARWSGERAWELSLIHHKLYLQNPPEGASDVSISHGFNIVGLTRAWRAGAFTWRAGGGPVITHAEAGINGVGYDGPYRLSGFALLAGVGWRRPLTSSLYLSIEAIATAGYAEPDMDGTPEARLDARNVALHGLIGLGYEL